MTALPGLNSAPTYRGPRAVPKRSAAAAWSSPSAAKPSARNASAEALRADGFAAEGLDHAAAAERLGTALGPRYVGALFKPGKAVIHSARYNFGLAQAAAKLGARFAYG